MILDYNRHAVPLDRLACSPDPVRRAFQTWLAGRLKIDPDEVWLPEPAIADVEVRDGPASGHSAGTSPSDRTVPLRRSAAREAGAFLETVEFTAVDFLADEPERDAEIHARFGPQVAELVRRDRQQNVRRAFRSFPLHELPLAARTINPYAFYEAHLAGGRIALLPFTLARGLGMGRRARHPGDLSRRSRDPPSPRSTASRSFPPTPTGPPCARFIVCANLCSWVRSGCGLVSTSNTWACRSRRPRRASPRSR